MPRCPSCHSNIIRLINVVSGFMRYTYPSGDYISDYDNFESDGDICEFVCPLCSAFIGCNEEDADKFLDRMI